MATCFAPRSPRSTLYRVSHARPTRLANLTNGRDRGDVSRKEAARDGDWATTVLRIERGGMVSADATGDWGARVYMRAPHAFFRIQQPCLHKQQTSNDVTVRPYL
jgi:hypothetical protein